MASKKLKLEVDLETTKAKRQLAGMADGGGGGSGPVPPADDLANALKKASKGATDFGDSAAKSSVSVQSAVRAFGGLAIGMAAQYSAKYLDEGSTARNAVEYGAGALQGASVGMMAGPWGAAAGGVIGLAKTFFDKEGEKKNKLEDFDKSERRYKETYAWKKQFDEMTYMGKDKSSRQEKITALEAELEKRKSAEVKISESVKQFTAKGEYENANHQKDSLTLNRQQQAQLESAIKTMKREQADQQQESRESLKGVDALSRVGGSFAGAGSGDALLRTSREQVDILRAIERKTGATTWQ